MKPEEVVALIAAAKAQGVSRLKMGDFEVEFNNAPMVAQPAAILLEEETEIKHKVEQLKSVMQLDDAELIERMFPLPNPEDAA